VLLVWKKKKLSKLRATNNINNRRIKIWQA
jgi:hypothetical protein